MSTLGDRVKSRRHRLGLTQEGLAQRANVRRPTIAELETNRRVTVSSEILRRLAQALSCTTDYLVGMYEDEDDEEAPRRRVAVVA
jgi:transcriptional regulator with XRE-family HTH domain